jgi:hypothetical protein
MRILLSAFVILVACACDKKEDAPRPTGKTREAVVNAGLASADGGMSEGAKSALVAQQCAIACGVHPELDGCTQTCAKECMSASDLGAVDTCARRIATPK